MIFFDRIVEPQFIPMVYIYVADHVHAVTMALLNTPSLVVFDF